MVLLIPGSVHKINLSICEELLWNLRRDEIIMEVMSDDVVMYHSTCWGHTRKFASLSFYVNFRENKTRDEGGKTGVVDSGVAELRGSEGGGEGGGGGLAGAAIVEPPN